MGVAHGSGGYPSRGRGIVLATLLALVLLGIATLPARAAAADLEDLLWDFQVAPLGGGDPPGFTLESLNGQKVSLGELRGRAVLLYFWATW